MTGQKVFFLHTKELCHPYIKKLEHGTLTIKNTGLTMGQVLMNIIIISTGERLGTLSSSYQFMRVNLANVRINSVIGVPIHCAGW